MFDPAHLHATSDVLFVDGPDSLEISWLIPSVQNGQHPANPSQVAGKDLFQVVAAKTDLLHDDPELVVEKEAHEEEDLRQKKKRCPTSINHCTNNWRGYSNEIKRNPGFGINKLMNL